MTIEQERWFLTGLMWAFFLACALLIIVPAFAHGETARFESAGGWAGANIRQAAPQCRITGLVYASEDLTEVDAVDITIPFDCPVTAQRFERRLVLTSPRWYVEIEIPRAGGWMRFAYTWGRDQAYLGARAIAITAGPVESAGWRAMQEAGG